jgi:zinc transport system substrate-binding protein
MKRNRRAALGFGIVLGFLLLTLGCGSSPNPWKDQPGPPRVLVTFPPLASFVKAIGGDGVGVLSLCEKVGPHHYSPTSEDAIKLAGADLFVWNGLGLDDSFALRLKNNTSNDKLHCRELAESLPEKSLLKDPNYKPGQPHQHDESGACCGGHGPFDPHVWLGLPQAVKMVEQLRDDLKEIDSARAAEYDRQAAEYVAELKALLADGRKKLTGFKTPIITHHEAMRYFAEQFGLNVVGSLQGLSGEEPDHHKLQELVSRCKGHPRVLVTVEPQYSSTIADVLRAESDLKKTEVILVELDPLETNPAGDELNGEWYIRKMRQNIEALARYAR